MPFSAHLAERLPDLSRGIPSVFHSSAPTTDLIFGDIVPMAHSVFWFSSSITCTYVCWLER